MNFEPRVIDARDGKVPDGLYHNNKGRYMWIKDGVFHFPTTMVDPVRAMERGYPVICIRDVLGETWRYFVRASHCLELYPASATDLKTIVARYGAKL